MHFILFLIGIVELYISATLTRSISLRKPLISGLITFINILLWYFVLRIMLDNFKNVGMVLVYAIGCSIGSILGTGGAMSFRHSSVHHRRPKSLGGPDSSRNTIKVNRKDHMAWHRLFRNLSPEDIAEEINLVWLDPDYKFEVRRVR